MRYKIKDIGEGGIDLCVVVSKAWLETECPDAGLGLSEGGVRLEGRIEPVGEGYLLRGTLKGDFTLPCARCLEPAPVPIDAAIAVTFVEREEGSSESENPEEDQDDVVRFEHGTIDVGHAIRDEILLAVPMTAICKEDCAGICATCGCNRNLTPCGCDKPSPETSKFAALAKMKLQ